MGFTNLWPLFLLIAVPPLIMLYILKRKYKEQVVSSSLLWKEVYKNTRANTPWEKFKKNIMLLLQLIILFAVMFALMKPFLNFGGLEYKNLIIVLDNTASMNTLYDGDKTRLDMSKEMAKDYIYSTKDDTNIFIISYDNTSNLLLNGDFNKNNGSKIIENLNSSYSSGDINEAVSFVKAIGEGIGEEYEALFFTDKEVSLEGVNGEVVYLANSGLNGSIDNISHKYIEDKLKVIATVTNRGDSIYDGDFSLYSGSDLLGVESLSLEVGESKTLSFDFDSIQLDYLKGELSRKDILMEDNIYYHVVSENKAKKILLVTEENVFLERAFTALDNTEVYKTNDPSNITDGDDFDLYIFDDLMPEVIPSNGNILFINPSSNEFFTVLQGGELGNAIAVKDSVSSYLQDTQFTLSNYNIIQTPYYGNDILTIDGKCIAFKGELDNRKIAALSFDLHNSDFALKKEFPILIYELGEELISTGMVYSSNFKGGEKIVVKSSHFSEEINVSYPSGKDSSINSGDEVNSNNELGIYKLTQNEKEENFAVNFPVELESNTALNKIESNKSNGITNSPLKRGINLTPLFILLAMLVVGFEWILYKKGN